MLQSRVEDQNHNHKTTDRPICVASIALTGRPRPPARPQRLSPAVTGDWEDNRAAGLYKGSGDPGADLCQDPCLNRGPEAYKDLIAKSGTSTLSPTIQTNFTGQKQLTLAREILKTRLVPTIEQQSREISSDDGPRDVRQVSFDGGQLPMSTCGAWAVVSECEAGHHFAKRLYCGREWCEVCGQDKSAAHKRRQARLLPKLQQCREVGYFVIEFPRIVRHIGEAGICPDMDKGERVHGWTYSKAALRETTSDIVSVLAGKRGAGGRGSKRRRGYFARGIARWHWFGDKRPGKYNPHLNVLVDSGSLGDEVRDELQPAIEAYKAKLASSRQSKRVRRELQGIDMYERGKSGYLPAPLLDRIKAELREALNCPELIIHYEKRDTPAKIVHCVRYITRATFRDSTWDRYMAQELWNFRNIRWWGSWQSKAAWQLGQAEAEGEDVAGLQAVEKLQAGVCPDCGQPLKTWHHGHDGKPVQWSRPVDSTYLLIWSATEIAGTGYYQVPVPVRPSGSVFTPGEILRLQELQAQAREKPSVHPFAVAMRRPVDELWRNTHTYKAMFRRKRERELDELAEDDAALESHGDGLPIRPEAEADAGEVEW